MLDHKVKYIDFHTHDFNFSEEIFKLNCFSLKDFNNSKIHYKNPFTVGIHPWDVKDLGSQDLDDLFKPFMHHKNYVGLGEVGLDKAHQSTYSLQTEVLKKQILWAIKNQIDFIVLHCVRAQNDLLKILKDCSYQGQVLFHDYNGSLEDWIKIKDKGYLISLGQKILNPKTKASRLVDDWVKQKKWPWGQAFLETDDQSQSSIKELYDYLGHKFVLDKDELKTHFIESLPKGMQKL